ncbi:hypothetical protein PV327_009692 [Microctonus hyperodae]|uniref:Uncharacterized protein n=1 Tax=Microctonus hyperodae TaxID=165561 RepID=A0AA39CBT7_MICHY|nr:hypothetical protein PV327_009692 [Microctonus hyperodae]
MEPSPSYPAVPPPSYSSIEQNNVSVESTHIPLAAGGPAYLPDLVRGQQIKSGPYTLNVTDSMVIQREQQNQEIYRDWMENQRLTFVRGLESEYFADFKDVQTRRTFIRKVFLILTVQLLFSAGYISFFMLYAPAKVFIVKYWWMWIFAMIGFILSYCSISITDCGRKQNGWGVICLSLLTLAETHLAAYVTVNFEIEMVLIAIGITATVTMAISFSATFFRFDFTKWGGLLSVLGMVSAVSLFAMMLSIILARIPIITTIMGVSGAIVFSLYLYYDIQTIMGGRKVQLSPNEVIFATTQLYIDIIGLYRYFLLVVARNSRSEY